MGGLGSPRSAIRDLLLVNDYVTAVAILLEFLQLGWPYGNYEKFMSIYPRVGQNDDQNQEEQATPDDG